MGQRLIAILTGLLVRRFLGRAACAKLLSERGILLIQGFRSPVQREMRFEGEMCLHLQTKGERRTCVCSRAESHPRLYKVDPASCIENKDLDSR